MNSPRTPAHALTLGFAALLATGLVGPAAAQIQVDVNGRPVSFGAVGPQRIGGRVLIPLRAVVEALGAEVTWDSATQTVLGRKGDREFSLPIGSRTATVNRESVNLDVPAQLIRGNTMVPLRFVAEALGAEVGWDAVSQQVAIRNGASGAPERSTPAASEERVRGEVVSVTPGRNASITVRSEGVRQTYRLERDTVVLLGPEGRRGVATELAQVRPGATVRLRLNATRDSAEMIEVFTRAGEDRTGSGSGPRTQRDPVDRGGRNPSASESVWGELIAIRARGERTTLTVQTRSGRESFELARDAEVTRTAAGRRNEQALHTDLRVGDRVRLTQDQDGGITRVDARGPGSSTPGAAPTSSRTLTGEVTAVRTGANPPTMTVTAGGRRTTLEVTRETDIYRAPGAGRRAVRANLDELQPGDTVRIRTDVTGTIAETIDVE